MRETSRVVDKKLRVKNKRKTASFRAFDWIYENKPAGKRIIRTGADYARATLYLSNGYIISRYIEAKRGGKNGYEITDPNTGEVEFHNTKILPEVQKLLGFNLLNIDKDLQFNLNFMKQGTGWFLIGDQYSAPQKAKIIGGIYGTQYADAVIRDIDSENKRTNEKIKDVSEKLVNTENRIKEFDYLPDLKKSIEFVEKALKEIKELKEKKAKIEKLLEKREQVTKIIDENNKTLDTLKDLDKAFYLLAQLKEQDTKRRRLAELMGKHENASANLQKMNQSLKALKNIDQAKEVLRQTNDMIGHRNAIGKMIVKHEDVSKRIKHENQVLVKTEQVGRAKRLTENLKKGFEKRNAIEKLIVKHDEMVKAIAFQMQTLKRTEQLDMASALLKDIQEKSTVRREMVLKVKRAKELEIKRADKDKSVRAIQMTVKRTEHIETLRQQIEKVKAQFIFRENIEKALLGREKISKSIYQEEQTIKQSKQQTLQDLKIYQELLEREGRCPVCFGTVDKATINRIVQEYIQN